MTQDEKLNKIKEQAAMIAATKKWSVRLKRLKDKKGMYNDAFCDKHGFHRAGFNRIKNGRVIPTKEKFDAIEAALKAEGV